MKYQVRIIKTTTVLIDSETPEAAISSALVGQGDATTTIQTSAVPKPASSQSGDEKAAQSANP